MLDGLYIQDARLADVKRLGEFTSQAWQATHQTLLPQSMLDLGTPGLFAQRWQSAIVDGCERTSCLVLYENDEIKGVGACGPYREVESPPDDTVRNRLQSAEYGEYYKGYTIPGSHSSIYADALFAACSHRLIQHGFDKAGLWTNASNERSKLFFQLILGGEQVSTRPAYVLDRFVGEHQEVFIEFDLSDPRYRQQGVPIRHLDKDVILHVPGISDASFSTSSFGLPGQSHDREQPRELDR